MMKIFNTVQCGDLKSVDTCFQIAVLYINFNVQVKYTLD